MTRAPIYVVVCQNDKEHPKFGRDPGGVLVLESYASMTLQQANARCAAMELHGACRVGRVIFENEPNFEVKK